jgi:hypothetical protein
MLRREFLKRASAAGLAVRPALGRLAAAEPAADWPLSFGIVTDVHHADIPPRGSHSYRLSLGKLREAVETLRQRRAAFIIELGDLIDEDPQHQDDPKYLHEARQVLDGFPGPKHYVLGNHCVWVLTKEQFLAGCGLQRSWYSFDAGPLHGVVLDACFTKDSQPYQPGAFDWKDSWIPAEQQQWLAEDLARARGRTAVVFVHQNLHDETRPCGVKNAPEVRRILQQAGNVWAVFQGHEHTGAYAQIEGIHYCTLRAMVQGPQPESNAFSLITLDGPRSGRLEGFGHQPSRGLT